MWTLLVIRGKQSIEIGQLRRFDFQVGDRGKAQNAIDQAADGLDVDRFASDDQPPQRFVDRVLALAGGQLENSHVRLVCLPLGMPAAEQVVSDAEVTGGKHFFAVLVIGKRPRLADQRIDHVAVVDRRAPLAEQPRHGLHEVVLITHLDLLGRDLHVNVPADQPAGHRVDVGPHPDRAALADAHVAQVVVGIEPLIRQFLQGRLFLEPAFLAVGIGGVDHLLKELQVIFAAGEVAAAAEHQRLVDAVLQMPV